jgi:hypothetical protein
LDEPCEPVPVDTGQSIANPATGECGIPECPCHDFSRSDEPHLSPTTTTDRQPLWADAATVRAAIADTLDAGCQFGNHTCAWLFFRDESDEQTELRGRFLDAVTARIRQLQQPPHSYPRRPVDDAKE